MNEREQDVQQTMVTLPHFHVEMPVLSLQDGTPYLPVVALCRMLGLRAETRIPRWRKLLLWQNARKLPLQTPTRGRRVVWCLPFGALPFWFCCFDWNAVLPERLSQLTLASQLTILPDRIHQEMLIHYWQLHRFLFWFLTTYKDVETELALLTDHLASHLDTDTYEWLEVLMREGRSIIVETTTLARKMLHEQNALPLVEACERNRYSIITRKFSRPLLPLVSTEDEENLFEALEMLQEWHQDLRTFLWEHERPRTDE